MLLLIGLTAAVAGLVGLGWRRERKRLALRNIRRRFLVLFINHSHATSHHFTWGTHDGPGVYDFNAHRGMRFRPEERLALEIRRPEHLPFVATGV